MSSAEVVLWIRLHGRTTDKPTFRRQHPVGSIILDFYCPAARLAVEVDGRTHRDDEARDKDRRRDAWLRTQDIDVMRIPASHIYHQLNTVVDAILHRANARRTSLTSPAPYVPRPLPPPRSGGRGTVGRA